MRSAKLGVLLAGGILAPLLLSGCGIPIVPGVFPPVLMPPWVTERMEEKLLFKNDYRTAIMQPILDGAEPPQCEDRPNDAQILRAASRVPAVFHSFIRNHAMTSR